MRLLLIRHGQTIDNANGALGTVVPGPGLTELGRTQAAAIPAALVAESIDAIAMSTMRRTHETAAPLVEALGLAPIEFDGLREITAGDIEGRSDSEAIRLYLGTLFGWWTDFSARIPGGEDGHEFHARYDGAIRELAAAHPEGTVAVFSHGAAIRTWASWSSGNIDAEFSRTHGLENTGIVILEGSPEAGWEAVSWQNAPLGGSALEDGGAPDPTGEATLA
ncbi:histidine phosphatase family protein [Herbiconiux moechotypicola]|uniref:Histidine phosphatase family protein n=1 Tax=Herbiconiux moechotypicola TaxID=637393 RepID=A0ABN3D7N2_9MICO|nr:histidine phosphatase family protein [Herbiconiux moechotypicola]MCS5728378.1 histidine phosphatase family protein [Herbiconiux moechotypicola]